MNSNAREAATRKKALDILYDEGWIAWYPPRTRHKRDAAHGGVDVFGKWDLVCIPRGGRQRDVTLSGVTRIRVAVRFIQLKSNMSGVIDPKYFEQKQMPLVTTELWDYNVKKRAWRRVHLDPTKRYLKEYGV